MTWDVARPKDDEKVSDVDRYVRANFKAIENAWMAVA